MKTKKDGPGIDIPDSESDTRKDLGKVRNAKVHEISEK